MTLVFLYFAVTIMSQSTFVQLLFDDEVDFTDKIPNRPSGSSVSTILFINDLHLHCSLSSSYSGEIWA